MGTQYLDLICVFCLNMQIYSNPFRFSHRDIQLKMTSMVAKSTSSGQMSPLASVQEKVSRNKRKFRADPPLGDPTKIIASSPNKCPGYEFSAEKFEPTPGHAQMIACDLCSVNQNHSDGLKLDLGLSTPIASSEVGPSRHTEELEADGFEDADWSDLTESQLEELVLSNLDAIFRSAIKKIVSWGYTEEVATKAVLRSGLCYGCKDTVSNIVDNTLMFLRNGQEIDPSKEHCFEDLQQLEKYILAELVCVLQEVRPFFSTGDAMWCLLICDMNVSHACAMDSNPSGGFIGDGAPNVSSASTQPQWKTEVKNPVINLPNHGKSVPSIDHSQGSMSETPNVAGVPSITKPMSSGVLGGLVSEKEGASSTSDPLDKSFSGLKTSQSPVLEEKFVSSRKVYSGSLKKDYIARHKSIHVEKHYRTYGCKGSSRSGKLTGLGGLISDKKLKSVTDCALNIKSTSVVISKTVGVDSYQDKGINSISTNAGHSSPAAFNLETLNTISSFHKTNIPAASPAVSALPELSGVRTPPMISTSDTDLSLSLPTKSNSASNSVNCDVDPPSSSLSGVPYDKPPSQWVSGERKDELILKLVPRVQELQNQLLEWTEWANQKVMQAARRLGKDKAELKTLRREKEEVERLRKEKQTLEENTMKKLSEMENALCKASGQVERANSAVRGLERENTALRREMETAKLHAVDSAANCQKVSKREKNTLMKFQSWEKQKSVIQEELGTEQRKAAQLLQELEQAKVLKQQLEARWLQEEKAKEEVLEQASSIRKEREQIEAKGKSNEDMIKTKAENNLQKYKDSIQKLEKEISQLRMKTDFSKIAALRRGIDGSYASRLADVKNKPSHKESRSPYISDYNETCSVKRERECVMCLSEEMSVVFLPCAHQVVCATCNELHEKQGMKDCPSCRTPIQRRVHVSYASS